MSQFEKVNTTRGAPQGRQEYGTVPQQWPRTVRLFRVNLDSGGYDDGGAYWGISKPNEWLFCAMDTQEYRRFIRAGTRLDAALLLGLPAELLLAAPKKQAERFLKATEGQYDTAANIAKAARIRELGYAP